MRPIFQDSGNQFFGVGSSFPCPLNDSGGSPFQIPLVAFRHVLAESFKVCGHIAPFVGGNSTVFEEDFHSR